MTSQCSSCGGFCGRVCQRGLAARALHSALYWQNRCCDLEEIIELFCIDAFESLQTQPEAVRDAEGNLLGVKE